MVTKKALPKKPAKKKSVAKLKVKAVPLPVVPAVPEPVVVPTAPAQPFKDRKTTLVLVGILNLMVGLVSVGMLLLLIGAQSSESMKEAGAGQKQGLGSALIVYAGMALAFFWLAIGLFLARRWARAIGLIIAWYGLLTGIIATPAVAYFMPKIFGMAAGDAGLDAGAQSWVIIFLVGFMAFLFILLPGLQILALQSPNVKKTCETRDPKTRWTDRCPLPVLAVVLVMACSSVSILFSALVMGKAYAFFGAILRGPVLWMAYLCLAAASGALAWGAYYLKRWAWGATMAFWTLWFLSGAVSFNNGSMMAAMQESGNLTTDSAKAMDVIFNGPGINIFFAATLILYGGYWIYCKKYFKAA